MSENVEVVKVSKRKVVADARPRRRRRVALPEGVSFDDAARVYALVTQHASPIKDALADMKPAVRAFAADVLAQALA